MMNTMNYSKDNQLPKDKMSGGGFLKKMKHLVIGTFADDLPGTKSVKEIREQLEKVQDKIIDNELDFREKYRSYQKSVDRIDRMLEEMIRSDEASYAHYRLGMTETPIKIRSSFSGDIFPSKNYPESMDDMIEDVASKTIKTVFETKMGGSLKHKSSSSHKKHKSSSSSHKKSSKHHLKN